MKIVRRLALLVVVFCCGCAERLTFPTPMSTRVDRGEAVFGFDTNRDGRSDFWQYQAADGRIHAIAYAGETPGEPGPRIDLDAIDPNTCPHFIIALDGVPFELVQELYDEGHFRYFHAPARVICCYPSVTDLALADVFHARECVGYQATYFDRDRNRLSDGNAVYLSGRNAPWLARVNYRCSLWWDVLVYLDPQVVFDHEVGGILKTFRKIDHGEGAAYSVGSAGLGTRGGRGAILAYLRAVDRLCEQLVYERHGRVKITLTADHGHNLTPNRRITFDEPLKACGFKLTKSLNCPCDVVAISYGLVTYVELIAEYPAGVGECLLSDADVEFACYPEGDAVVVRDRAGVARVRKGEHGYFYDAAEGDPLRLVPIIERLRAAGKVSASGEIDDRAFFDATVDHYYPDALARVWRAFHGLVENPPNLIVNLRDGACYGSAFFNAMVGGMTSTHGSLNRRNSTTFALTTLGDLPPAMRSVELLPAVERLRGQEGDDGHPLATP